VFVGMMFGATLGGTATIIGRRPILTASQKSICGVALHPRPVEFSLRETASRFNRVNHCSVLLCTPHSSSEFILSLSKDASRKRVFAKLNLHLELFTVPSTWRLFTKSANIVSAAYAQPGVRR